VSGTGISWAICKSAPRFRQITTPAPHRSVFLQAGCPSCCLTNSVKALKTNFVIVSHKIFWVRPICSPRLLRPGSNGTRLPPSYDIAFCYTNTLLAGLFTQVKLSAGDGHEPLDLTTSRSTDSTMTADTFPSPASPPPGLADTLLDAKPAKVESTLLSDKSRLDAFFSEAKLRGLSHAGSATTAGCRPPAV